MSNIDFEAHIKERLYNHAEPVDPESWEVILAKQKAHKRRQLMSKCTFYGATMAAAAVILFFMLRTPDTDLSIPPYRHVQVVGLPDSVYMQTAEQALEQDDPAMMPTDFMTQVIPEKRTTLIAVATLDSMDKQMAAPPSDSRSPSDTLSLADAPSRPEPNTRYEAAQHPDLFRQRRPAVSDKWAIALVTAYSNAAGKAPFVPMTQVMSGKTRLFSLQSSGQEMENQDASALSFAPPISIGVNFQKEIYPWLSIGVGMSYTLLQSKFSSSYSYMGGPYTTRQSLHYVGFPVTALVQFVHQPNVRAYAFAGGMVEKAVTAYYTSSSKYTSSSENKYVKGLQWSLQAGLGVEVPLSHFFSVYVEPGVGYFFDCEQPRSIRTVQPTQFKAEFGLRMRI